MFRRAANGFDLVAPVYDFFTALVFGGRLHRAQTEFLPRLSSAQKILIFGGGSGKILIDILTRTAAEKIYYVDISRQMILRAERRLASHRAVHKATPPVSFICGSWNDIPSVEFDLIVTPFVLDCFQPAALNEVMQCLSARLALRGQWLFTDFHVPEGMMRPIASAVTRVLYVAFNLLCGLGVKRLPDFAAEFAALGMQKTAEKYSLKGMLVSRVYER